MNDGLFGVSPNFYHTKKGNESQRDVHLSFTCLFFVFSVNNLFVFVSNLVESAQQAMKKKPETTKSITKAPKYLLPIQIWLLVS